MWWQLSMLVIPCVSQLIDTKLSFDLTRLSSTWKSVVVEGRIYYSSSKSYSRVVAGIWSTYFGPVYLSVFWQVRESTLLTGLMSGWWCWWSRDTDDWNSLDLSVMIQWMNRTRIRPSNCGTDVLGLNEPDFTSRAPVCHGLSVCLSVWHVLSVADWWRCVFVSRRLCHIKTVALRQLKTPTKLNCKPVRERESLERRRRATCCWWWWHGTHCRCQLCSL